MAEGTVEIAEETEKVNFADMSLDQQIEWLWDLSDAIYALCNKLREKKEKETISEAADGGLKELAGAVDMVASKLGITIQPRNTDLSQVAGWQTLDFNRDKDIAAVKAYQASKGSKCADFSVEELEQIRALEVKNRTRGVK